MKWHDYSKLKGTHALLAPSSCSWLNYDDADLYSKVVNGYATQIGTALHELAEDCINHSIKINSQNKNMVLLHLLKNDIPRYAIDIDRLFDNFKIYVNDAIGYKMDAEVVLYYSDNAYGTADAIFYKNNFLRIHDFKSGNSPVHMEQLRIYAALFCLEYKVKPSDIQMELRIYQNSNILLDNPSVVDIAPIMDKIIHHDELITLWNGKQ